MQRVSLTAPFEVFEKSEILQGIHQRFEKQAQKYPLRTATKDPEQTLAYATLNDAANNIAQTILKKKGPMAGQVAFVLENTGSAIATLIGILKANKSYVPLDPSFPKERTAYMFDYSESELILTDYAHRDLAAAVAGRTVPVLLIDDVDIKKPAENPDLKIDPMCMAYLLFTSGSTGKPKGIAFCHRNLLHTTMCLINNLQISADDRMTQLHSTSFAASVVDIYCPLLNGGSVYPWDVKTRGIAGLSSWLQREAVTCIQWIPTPFRQLMGSLKEGEQFGSVRFVVMASEPLTRREFDLYRAHFPNDCTLVNQIGTSESYNYYLFFANKDTIFEGSNVPAGYPVSGDREVLLLDENRAEVGPGQIGEIAIRSEFMSLGYWRNPELTDKAFLRDDNGTAKKIYLTGDLGKRLDDGCLIHLGRKDFQVKIRGYRIELPEVEIAFKNFKHIRDVAVAAQPDRDGELRLIGYYISDNGKDFSVTELRRELATNLPDYMIPQVFVRMSEFPMTPSGKIDKKSLPAPDESRPVLDNELVAPATALEATLAEIWKDVLGCKDLGVTDDFFELGGDSLHATIMLQLIETRCGLELGYTVLFKAPRIRDLAVLIEQARLESRVGRVGVLGETSGWKKERLLRGLFNRILQVLALYGPGASNLRVWLHRLRGVRIGQNVTIGTAAILETACPQLIRIGDDVAIGIRNVIIGHFSDSTDHRADGRGATVRICNNVYLGPSVTVLPNVTIGEGSVVTAGSVVNKSVSPGTMVQGNPARPVAFCGVPLVGRGCSYEKFLRHLRLIEVPGSNKSGSER
ncbi:MAG: AMP-binding protein [Bryobacteraceae bacterium]